MWQKMKGSSRVLTEGEMVLREGSLRACAISYARSREKGKDNVHLENPVL